MYKFTQTYKMFKNVRVLHELIFILLCTGTSNRLYYTLALMNIFIFQHFYTFSYIIGLLWLPFQIF